MTPEKIEIEEFGTRRVHVPTEHPIALDEALDLGNLFEFLRLAATRGDSYPIGTGEDGGILDSLIRVENILKTTTIETPVTGEVAEFRDEIQEKYGDDDILNQADRDFLKEKSVAWHHLLRDALGREQRIPAENTGLLDVNRLIDSPEELFSKPVWSWLDARPKSDLKEACKTIVVGCSTASVMLSLRAVEHALREWYDTESEGIDAPWGQALDQLMEEYTEDDKRNDTVASQLSDLPPVLSNLYYLKEKRNEVSHPDKSPDSQEARRTLMIVAATITDIYNEVFEGKISTLKAMDTVSIHGEEIDIHFDGEDIDELFYSIIQQLDDGDGAAKAAVYELALDVGFGKHEVEEIIQDLLMRGSAYEPSDGRLRAI